MPLALLASQADADALVKEIFDKFQITDSFQRRANQIRIVNEEFEVMPYLKMQNGYRFSRYYGIMGNFGGLTDAQMTKKIKIELVDLQGRTQRSQINAFCASAPQIKDLGYFEFKANGQDSVNGQMFHDSGWGIPMPPEESFQFYSDYGMPEFGFMKKIKIKIPDAYTSLTYRLTYTYNGVDYKQCNSETFSTRPRGFLPVALKTFTDDVGETFLKDQVISVTEKYPGPSMTESSAVYGARLDNKSLYRSINVNNYAGLNMMGGGYYPPGYFNDKGYIKCQDGIRGPNTSCGYGKYAEYSVGYIGPGKTIPDVIGRGYSNYLASHVVRNYQLYKKVPTYIAGKPHAGELGLAAVDIDGNIIRSYNGTLKKVIIGNFSGRHKKKLSDEWKNDDKDLSPLHSWNSGMGCVLGYAGRIYDKYGFPRSNWTACGPDFLAALDAAVLYEHRSERYDYDARNVYDQELNPDGDSTTIIDPIDVAKYLSTGELTALPASHIYDPADGSDWLFLNTQFKTPMSERNCVIDKGYEREIKDIKWLGKTLVQGNEAMYMGYYKANIIDTRRQAPAELDTLTKEFSDIKFKNGIAGQSGNEMKLKDGSTFDFNLRNIGAIRFKGYAQKEETAGSVDYYDEINLNVPYGKFDLLGAGYMYSSDNDTKVKHCVIVNAWADRRCYAVIEDNFIQYIPDHVELSNIKISNFGKDPNNPADDNQGFTYLRNVADMVKVPKDSLYTKGLAIEYIEEPDMYATVSFDVEVKNADGSTPIGFTKNCFARDMEFKLELRDFDSLANKRLDPKITDKDGKKLTYQEVAQRIGFFPTIESTQLIPDKTNPFDYRYIADFYLPKVNPNFEPDVAIKPFIAKTNPYGMTIFQQDKTDGSYVLKADAFRYGKAKAKVRINFDRSVSYPIKPFEITSDMFTIQNQNIKIPAYEINGKGMSGKHTYTDNPNITKAKFYYGIVYSKDYKELAPKVIKPTPTFGVYCGDCDQNQFKLVDTANPTKSWSALGGTMSGWYINEQHEQNLVNTHGYVTKYDMQTNSVNIMFSPASNPSTHVLNRYPYYDELEIIGKKSGLATIDMPTNAWLVYDRDYFIGRTWSETVYYPYYNRYLNGSFDPSAPFSMMYQTAINSAYPTSNGFIVQFIGAGDWAGRALDKDGRDTTTGSFIDDPQIPQSETKQKRIEW